MDRLYEAIGFEVLLNVKGNDVGHCLFPENHSHGDTTGKFAIHRQKKVWNCWICSGGSLLSLVMQLYDMTSEEAEQWLYQFTEETDDGTFVGQMLELLDTSKPIDRHYLPFFNPAVLDRYQDQTDYLLNRGISQRVVDECRIRFSQTAKKKSPKADDIDYTGPGVIFPHFWQERLVGWQIRWLEDERPRWVPKYTNTTEFPKAYTLYNYDYALAHSDQKVVICESVPTTLILRSHGIPAVAYFGSSPKEEQLRLMRRFTNGVILAPDNDHNGDDLLRIATSYLERYIDVWIAPRVEIPHGDLGDYGPYEDAGELINTHLSLSEPSYLVDTEL